jgi:membrane associated rhomboid family serine protease
VFILPFIKDNPVRKTPWVLFTVVFANGVVLIGEYLNGNNQTLFLAHGFVPAHASATTAFTSMFLHAGFWHFLGNMFFFWMFGNRVENLFGRWLFAATYLVSGFGATACYYVLNLHSTVPCVGASGAISGIAGCFLVLFPRARFDLVFYLGYIRLKTIETRALAAVLAWLGEQTLLGLLTSALHVAGGVAYWAHFGGFVAGVTVGLLFRLVAGEKLHETGDLVEPQGPDDPLQPRADEFTELKL